MAENLSCYAFVGDEIANDAAFRLEVGRTNVLETFSYARVGCRCLIGSIGDVVRRVPLSGQASRGGRFIRILGQQPDVWLLPVLLRQCLAP